MIKTFLLPLTYHMFYLLYHLWRNLSLFLLHYMCPFHRHHKLPEFMYIPSITAPLHPFSVYSIIPPLQQKMNDSPMAEIVNSYHSLEMVPLLIPSRKRRTFLEAVQSGFHNFAPNIFKGDINQVPNSTTMPRLTKILQWAWNEGPLPEDKPTWHYPTITLSSIKKAF